MTALWTTDGSGWELISPTGFPDEATLHRLVDQSPELLPLSGSPQLVVLGSEVRCGTGFIDVVAAEPSGRLALIEVKLAANAEARRAVVAQLLSYAAWLHGASFEDLQQLLAPHLAKRDCGSVAEALAREDQEGTFEAEDFTDALRENLRAGRFRLVFVLDEAPADLARLVGFLEAVTDGLLIDLVTVSAYDVGQARVLVPQRVEPERIAQPGDRTPTHAPRDYPRPVEGSEEFERSIGQARTAEQDQLRRLLRWARTLESEGLARLHTTTGKGRWVLVPRVSGDHAGLTTIWNEGGGYMTLFRSVFERRGATRSLARIEQLVAPAKVGTGTKVPEVTDELLDVLTGAYREATGA